MNGAHDLGGMHGFGPVAPEPDEPVFHAAWEQRVFALVMAAGFLGRWNLDMSRSAREQMPPAEYLATSYYEHWLFGLETLLDARGLLARAELDARLQGAAGGAEPHAPVRSGDARRIAAENVERTLRRSQTARVETQLPARFRPGERVLARNVHPLGHTRLPRYVRGRRGVIDADHGVWVFPDTNALGQGTRPQHCYSVVFEASELWGPGAPGSDRVYLDLFEDYLEPA